MSYMSPPNNLYEIIFQLMINGYKPILAHPERYRFLHQNFKEYYKLKKAGCELQINLLSTTGYYGPDILKIADKLLKEDLINYVGSDIHHLNHVKFFNKKVSIKNIDKLKEAINNNLNFN